MLLTFGLFETAADVCATLNALSKAGFEPDDLSLMARDLESDTGEQNDRHTTIAQAIDALGLAPAIRHMYPSALVVIPEEGTYLTAGWPARELTRPLGDAHPAQTRLRAFLSAFGCDSEEAGFLDGRLQAGSLLVGVTDTDEARLTAAREIFADQQVIHVGAADLPHAHLRPWSPVDAPRPDSYATGDVIVLDVAMLAVSGAGTDDPSHELIGGTLSDENGAEIGTITGIVSEQDRADERAPEYIIVQHGGFLGVGQHAHAIPFGLVSAGAAAGSYRARLDIEVLENAPAFDASFPISRREEQSICGYYGLAPYWDGNVRDWPASEIPATIGRPSHTEAPRAGAG